MLLVHLFRQLTHFSLVEFLKSDAVLIDIAHTLLHTVVEVVKVRLDADPCIKYSMMFCDIFDRLAKQGRQGFDFLYIVIIDRPIVFLVYEL